MSEKIRVAIEGDPATGEVNVTGPLNNTAMMHWLLGETRRLVENKANERDRLRKNGGILVPEMTLRLKKP